MWSFFRKETTDPSFPQPKWPPIQELDSVDLTGLRHDGGVDLVILASQPLDDSPAVVDSIRRKVRTYLATIDNREYQIETGHPPRDLTTIIIVCEHPIHPEAQTVIDECWALAAERGVRLEVRKSLD